MMKLKNNWWQQIGNYFCLLNIVLLLGASIIHFFKTDFYYDTDIARDFLILAEMRENGRPTLIGGRTSMDGVFHGPFYYYLLLPVFIIGQGNPIFISYIWLVFYLVFIYSYYQIIKKTFSTHLALWSTTLIISLTIGLTSGYTHTVLANFTIMPIIFFIYKYLNTNKVYFLALASFMLGLLVQWQIAFAIPTIIIFTPFIFYHLYQKQQWSHLLACFLILIPLSTYLVFDWRHDFIQSKSLLNHVFTNNQPHFSLNGYWPDRYTSFINTFNLWQTPWHDLGIFAKYSIIILITYLTYRQLTSPKKRQLLICLSLSVIWGFWLVTSPFQGNIWPQYYLPLLPLIVLCFIYTLFNYIPPKITYTILTLIITSHTFYFLKNQWMYLQSSNLNDEIHWRFYRQLVRDIINDSAKQEFGYFIFTPDQFAYQAKYALKYFTQKDQIKTAPYQKRSLTYLIFSPYWDDNKFLTKEYWREEQVKIKRLPDKKWNYDSPKTTSYTVFKYYLSTQEATIEASPFLINGLHFR